MANSRARSNSSSPLISRLAISGMVLAVIALGALAVWATILAQEHSRELSRAGVQTSGHLRATQALGQIDTHSDLLEDGIDAQLVDDLRHAQRVLRESLTRMQRGSVVAAERRLARDAVPAVEELERAVDHYLGVLAEVGGRDSGRISDDDDAAEEAEEGMEDILDELQLRFNDISFDPSEPLRVEAAAAADDESVVHRTALVLVPLGLLFAALCAWQLRTFRVRSEAERERMEAELRLGQRLEAVGQLAAGIAHEINTPIQFVGDSVGFLKGSFDELSDLEREYKAVVTNLAEDRDDGAAILARMAEAEDRADLEYLRERIPAAFERTQDGISRVAAIVAAMKDFGRPRQVEHAPADINEALHSTLVVAQNEYKYVAQVETDLADLPPVVCNVSELNQVFVNLIVNAAHAIQETAEESGQQGLIRVATARQNGTAIVTISDNGRGIPLDIRERIFDPFFTTKEVGRGTGQGLAIARSIVVDKHGGTLTVDSTVGRGTTFSIQLPIGADGAVATPSTP
jgi:signal transduction histidine kinase